MHLEPQEQETGYRLNKNVDPSTIPLQLLIHSMEIEIFLLQVIIKRKNVCNITVKCERKCHHPL